MLSLFVKNCKNLSIPSPQPEIGGIPYCIALMYSVSILIASSSPLAFNSACSINLFSCSSQSTSSEYPFIISCPFTTNWNLSVNFGFSSLLLASGDKSIGCSIRYVGFIMFGLLTFCIMYLLNFLFLIVLSCLPLVLFLLLLFLQVSFLLFRICQYLFHSL